METSPCENDLANPALILSIVKSRIGEVLLKINNAYNCGLL